MTRSLRARLFVGLTAIIVLAGCIGGVFSYFWAFDEAIEMQDSTLIQIGSLLQNGGVKSDQSLRGVDADTQVDVVELGMTPRGTAEERQLWSLQDGLHVASRRAGSMRVLVDPAGWKPVCRVATYRCSGRYRGQYGASHAAAIRGADPMPAAGHGAGHRGVVASDGPAGR
jgi:hypothetical protein